VNRACMEAFSEAAREELLWELDMAEKEARHAHLINCAILSFCRAAALFCIAFPEGVEPHGSSWWGCMPLSASGTCQP